MYQVSPRTLPSTEAIRYSTGSDFFFLSRDFVEYLTYEINDPLLNGLLTIYNHTVAAPERFFQTFLKNSHFCDAHFNKNLRMVNWDHTKKKGCHCNRPSADWCGCSPITLSMENVKFIEDIKKFNEFMGRKFDSTLNMEIINYVDKYLYGKDVPAKYWLNVWHHK